MRVLAVSTHPDDIEFMMAGTLLLLKDRGHELHYINVANGSCGTDRISVDAIISIRRKEGMRAAALLGAAFHESFVNDLEVFYAQDLIRRMTALVREVKPDIILVPSLEDYMEDHMNTARITVTAAFCRGLVNYESIPEVAPYSDEVSIYHALPHTLTDGMRRPIIAEFYVGIDAVMNRKEAMLACHQSQKEWLDVSQGFDSYLTAMRQISTDVARRAGRFTSAEGWRRHSHVGFSARDGNPLGEELKDLVVYDKMHKEKQL